MPHQMVHIVNLIKMINTQRFNGGKTPSAASCGMGLLSRAGRQVFFVKAYKNKSSNNIL